MIKSGFLILLTKELKRQISISLPWGSFCRVCLYLTTFRYSLSASILILSLFGTGLQRENLRAGRWSRHLQSTARHVGRSRNRQDSHPFEFGGRGTKTAFRSGQQHFVGRGRPRIRIRILRRESPQLRHLGSSIRRLFQRRTNHHRHVR